jgi:hypothetical protein
MSKLSELYCDVTGAMCRAGFMPEWIPFIGDLREKATEWAKANPDKAEHLADEVAELIKEYKKP